MKRFWYIIIMVCMVFAISRSGEAYSQVQGVLCLSEDFTDTIFPGPGWVANSVTRVTSAGSFFSAPAAASYGSHTGSLTLPAVSNPCLLRFQLGRTTSTADKLMIVEISTDGGLTDFTPADTFSNDNTLSNAFTLCEVDLSPYANSDSVLIRLRKASSTTAVWRVDDIEVYSTTTLPVTLAGFRGLFIPGKGVLLQWQTASEENNSHFTIERSADGEHFVPAGRVEGAGNSTAFRSYQFIDEKPIIPVTYYRLAQTDYNGKVNLSHSVQVNAGSIRDRSPGIASLRCLPDGISVELENFRQGTASVKIVDAQGKLLHSEEIFVAGDQKMFIQRKLKPGIYVLAVSDKSLRITRKFSVGLF